MGSSPVLSAVVCLGVLCVLNVSQLNFSSAEEPIATDAIAYRPLGEGLDELPPETDDRLVIDLVPDINLPTGLTKSRWAMDDPEYAVKYANGVPKTNVFGKIKQASDARFIDNAAGGYFSAGITDFSNAESALASLECGYTGYWKSYLTNRVGLVLAFSDTDYFLGAETGFRLQTPTRLAPFAGLGLFAGVANVGADDADEWVDQNNDGAIDFRDEQESGFDGAMAAVYPEAGIHFWWTPRIRLSGFGRYMITTEGRDADAWYYGFSMAVLSH
ncbi:hypothetical protein [Novipirellula aureliae]|nr:hypothetical protein [Novipirellula aureliae]